MTLFDPEEAHKMVTRFLALLPEMRSPREGWEGRFTNPREEPLPQQIWGTYTEYERAVNQAFIGLQPLMEELTTAIDQGGISGGLRSGADTHLHRIGGRKPSVRGTPVQSD